MSINRRKQKQMGISTLWSGENKHLVHAAARANLDALYVKREKPDPEDLCCRDSSCVGFIHQKRITCCLVAWAGGIDWERTGRALEVTSVLW